MLPLSGLGCDWRHLYLVLAWSYFLPLQGSKQQFSMQTSPLTLPCSAAQPCPVLSFAQPPAVRWLWITSASMVHRIRWDRGFKNKPGPAINKEKTPVTHPVNYPSSLLEDNIRWNKANRSAAAAAAEAGPRGGPCLGVSPACMPFCLPRA